MLDNSEIKDIFGIEPAVQSAHDVTKASIEGVSTFLGSIFKPGLEELGYLVKDRVREWRLNNIVRTLEKAQGKMFFDGHELQLTANARVGLSIMEGCSEVDDDELQELWAGLFVSSCTPDGRDDSNMNFVDLLKRMSSVEAKIIDYSCLNCKKTLYPNNLLFPQHVSVSFEELVKISGINDLYRLDSELDHMRSIELLESNGAFHTGGGFNTADSKLDANLTPSPLALTLYYKTHPNGKSPIEYWGESVVPFKEGDDVGLIQPKKNPVNNIGVQNQNNEIRPRPRPTFQRRLLNNKIITQPRQYKTWTGLPICFLKIVVSSTKHPLFIMNDMTSFSKYQLELEKFLLSRGEQKYTHSVKLNVKYEGEGIEPLEFQNANVLFDFNDNDSNRIYVSELAQAPNEYYEDFRPLFQSFKFDSQQGCLTISGSGTYGPYKVILFQRATFVPKGFSELKEVLGQPQDVQGY